MRQGRRLPRPFKRAPSRPRVPEMQIANGLAGLGRSAAAPKGAQAPAPAAPAAVAAWADPSRLRGRGVISPRGVTRRGVMGPPLPLALLPMATPKMPVRLFIIQAPPLGVQQQRLLALRGSSVGSVKGADQGDGQQAHHCRGRRRGANRS